MKKITIKLDNLINSLPTEEQEVVVYRDKFREYSNECGCSMGAVFLLISLGVIGVYFSMLHEFVSISFLLMNFLLGVLLLFVSTITGKIIGIAIAKVKLILLYKHLVEKYSVSESLAGN